MKKTIKKKKVLEIPLEPLSEIPDEEFRSIRLKRSVWAIGISAVLILLLAWALTRGSSTAPASSESFSQGENSPDAVIQKFHLVSTVQGQKKWEFYSDVARLYQNQKLAYSDNIYAQYYKKDKLVSTLTADKAVINTDSNATQAEGHVELIVENGSKLETDKLNWNPDTDQIKTEGRVHIFKGQDDITAVGMVADTQLNNIRFNKDVHTQVRDTHEIETFSKPKPF